jgi:hypothetical protein
LAVKYKWEIVSDKKLKEIIKKGKLVTVKKVNSDEGRKIFYIWTKTEKFELFEGTIIADKGKNFLVKVKWRIENVIKELEVDKKRVRFDKI